MCLIKGHSFKGPLSRWRLRQVTWYGITGIEFVLCCAVQEVLLVFAAISVSGGLDVFCEALFKAPLSLLKYAEVETFTEIGFLC